ncbi:RraA family protein [Alicyclobacillus fastidiosus]|uniref:Putative 4-hydroxy-4-methyl-2-oxoglutarate aldolase n=1 Tax=Alicyclobacillus fastidiosus TaxID=392011 RepID=A0ABV5A948_9BACL|nr:RraA family protein [Alicyclobacillus fastidiosus]WEH10739.1 RraA family protein [Alicyclobacillus fastidiosus]
MSIGFRVLPLDNRPSQMLIDRFLDVPTPYISDNMNRLYGLASGLVPYHQKGQLLGPAITVKTRAGDNLMVHKAIDLAQPGDVVVVDAGGDLSQAIVGEIMLRLAERKGLHGFVVDGAIRDSEAFRAGDFPVYARAVTHRGPFKDGPGEVNVPISVGGMVVHPGDIMVGDADGVIAVPVSLAEELATKVQEQRDREIAILDSIANGEVDRRWVDQTLVDRGCELIEGVSH